jgi:hypothetical protein
MDRGNDITVIMEKQFERTTHCANGEADFVYDIDVEVRSTCRSSVANRSRSRRLASIAIWVNSSSSKG